jgi:arabinofuranosyltransferase
VSEDGYIYLRIVDNLLAGHGPVFNLGERVEAYTSPAWLALAAAAVALLPGDPAWALVWLGLLLSVAGLGLAGLGALRLLRARGGPAPGSRVLPVGLLVVAVLPPFWDYATSGLETGLVFAWLGASFAGLALAGARRPAWLAALLGLGVLVRPDLAVFALGFLAVLVLPGRASLRRRAGLVLAAAALPAAYQLFRMGYFAALVPNTALAKEPGVAFWSRGAGYLWAFVRDYALLVPLAVLAAWALRGGPAGALRHGGWRRREALLAWVPLACAAVHALYVVRLGGDYMHARMLLPSLFAALLPVAVAAPARRWAVAVPAVVGAWALVCALALQAPSRFDLPEDTPWYDQRTTLIEQPGVEHPVTLADYAHMPWSQPSVGWALARLPPSVVLNYRRDRRTVDGLTLPWKPPVPLGGGIRPSAAAHARVLAYTGSIGRMGVAAGPEVRIADRFGLADPLASRVRLAQPRVQRAGHEKSLPASWFLARFATGRVPLSLRANVAAARRALRCPPLRRVVEATTAPLTLGRAVENLGVAVRAHGLRFDSEPQVAARELCGS